MSDPASVPPLPLPAHAEVLAEAFRLFHRGVTDRRSAFRTPTVATVGPDNVPCARTMVLRAFDPAARCVALHTDRRASKLDDIARVPRAAVHVYDVRAALQVRLSALAFVHAGDGVARARWAASAPSARAHYAISPAPGTEVPAPPAACVDQEAGFANFAVLLLTFDRLESLWLHHSGHRRARFVWEADGSHRAAWLVP